MGQISNGVKKLSLPQSQQQLCHAPTENTGCRFGVERKFINSVKTDLEVKPQKTDKHVHIYVSVQVYKARVQFLK